MSDIFTWQAAKEAVGLICAALIMAGVMKALVVLFYKP